MDSLSEQSLEPLPLELLELLEYLITVSIFFPCSLCGWIEGCSLGTFPSSGPLASSCGGRGSDTMREEGVGSLATAVVVVSVVLGVLGVLVCLVPLPCFLTRDGLEAGCL